jgi:hypothetical protein
MVSKPECVYIIELEAATTNGCLYRVKIFHGSNFFSYLPGSFDLLEARKAINAHCEQHGYEPKEVTWSTL